MPTPITIQGVILQRRDTTEAWEYVNPVLPYGQLGWETDTYGNPIGVKMGYNNLAWSDLPYWFQNGIGGGGRVSMIPSDPRISQNLSTGVLTVDWDSSLVLLFGQVEATFKVVVADGYDYVQVPYLPRYQYTAGAVTQVEYNGFFDTDYKIIITI